jgi:WhiB family redox-sensing transcriptional regulator
MSNETLSIELPLDALYHRVCDFAACKDVDPEMFYNEEGARGRRRTLRENDAKAVCGACVVKSECLLYAITTAEPHGVWGGSTEDERRRLRDRKNYLKPKDTRV